MDIARKCSRITNANNGEDFRTLLSTLDEFGYGVSWRVLDAKYFGTPQRRRRVYIIGSLGSLRSAEVLFEQGATSITDKSRRSQDHSYGSDLEGSPKLTNYYAIQHAGIGRKPSRDRKQKDIETMEKHTPAIQEEVRCYLPDECSLWSTREAAGFSGQLDSARWRTRKCSLHSCDQIDCRPYR